MSEGFESDLITCTDYCAQAGGPPTVEDLPPPSEIHRQIEKLPLFRELDPAQLAAIAARARRVALDKGSVLFEKGDEANHFYLVVEGQVKLAFSSVQGNEKVLDIVGPGQTFGEAVVFLGQPFPVRAEALSAAAVIQIASQGVFDLLAADPLFARKLLAGLSRRLHQLVNDVETYSLCSSSQRVIGYLLQLCPDGEGGQALQADLPTSKQVIASRLSLTPETLSRVLHELSTRGLIEMRGRHIRIPDPRALRAFGL